MSLLRIKQADGSWENIPAIKGADGINGKDGAIQYTAGRYIQIDEDTQTINCTVKIGDLVIIDAVPVKDSTNVVSSGGVYDALEAKADKTEIAGLGSEAGFITNSVEDLKNYYKKSETYSQDEVNSLLGNLTRLTLQVVQELPETGTEHIIYLVPNNESGNNIYEEWIFVQSKWEMIGTTEVDLSGYATKEYVDNKILDAIPQKSEMPEASADYLDKVYQYIGEDTEEFTKGFFYQCISETAEDGTVTYSWSELKFNTSSDSEVAPTIVWNGDTGEAGIAEIQKWVDYYNATGIFLPIYISKGSNDTYTDKIQCLTTVDTYLKNATSYVIGIYGISKLNSHFNKDIYVKLTTLDVRFTDKTRTTVSSFIVWGGAEHKLALDYNGSSDASQQGCLPVTNTKEYTPTADYHPATKKYVDDAIANSSGSSGGESSSVKESPLIDLNINASLLSGNLNITDEEILGKVSDAFTKYNKGEISLPIFNVMGSLTSIPQLIFIHEANSTATPLSGNIKYSGYAIHSIAGTLKAYSTILAFTVSSDDDNNCTVSSMTFANAANAKVLLTPENTSSYTPTGDYNPATKKYVDEAVANAGAGGGDNIDLSNVLTKDNTEEFTPDGDYEPATKKYVDDQFSSILLDDPKVRVLDLSDTSMDPTSINYNFFSLAQESQQIFCDFINESYNIETSNHTLIPIILCNFHKTIITISSFEFSNVSDGTKQFKFNFTITSASGQLRYGNFDIRLIYENDKYVINKGYITSQENRNYLSKYNTSEYIPSSNYHPATKKYVDDAVAAAGGSGEGTDLSNYYNKEEVDAKVAPLVSATDVLTKTNTTEYTPASAYHPATKQYVDQTVASSGAITEEADPTVPLYVKNITQDMITKWNNAPTTEDVTNAATTAVNSAGFIKTETDPAFQSSAASGILDSDIENWNGKADLKDIDSALIAASGANFSTEIAANPLKSTVTITMTEDLNQLVTDCKTSVDNGESPKFNLKVTYNGMTEDLHFKYYKSTSQKDKLYFKALTSIQPETEFHTYHSTPFLTAIIEMYNLTSTNKSMNISYEDLISVRSLSDANAYTPAPWGDDFVAYPSSRIEDPVVTLTTTLDIANLNGYYQFEKSTSSSLPSLIATELILGIKGSNICINFEPSGTSITKGRAQTFTEMMESIKITDENSRDVGKYILAETYIDCNVSDYITVYTKNGQYEQILYRNTLLGKLGVEDNHVYLRGSESGQIIVAKLVEDGDYDSADNYLASSVFRMTLEIDPDENKALASSTVDLGKITGMHRKEIIETDCAAYGGVLIRPYINETSSNKISALSFCSLDLTKETVWE